ncbi:hypothetical protein AVL62_05180 [Serinicoccus chungangensis]|uniref:DUF2550 domain-containing protein n=1 Tax=Serinicoccus chungangensis TaxID=767452 RepID=A0A0W8I8G7_9MICO|nr:DUF2550 family protein [Serinicoccus chungangensis]KUG55688.1 hypothetical protein AVL62_05180 [Serinicoccus chungangensis]
MTGAGAIVLVLMALVGALVILGLGLLTFRIAGERGSMCPPMPAAYRDAERPWRRGTLRFTEDRLSLRGRGGPSVGPWMRGNLDLGVAGPLETADAAALGGAALIRVPVSYGTARFELALGEQHYTALRSWVEAVPPGWNSHVA